MKINFLRESICLLWQPLYWWLVEEEQHVPYTGWGINSKDGGFQYNIEFEDQESGPGLVLSKEEPITKTSSRRCFTRLEQYPYPTACHVFFIDETEVTNLMYMEYLDWLETVFPPSEPRYRQIYEGALPDTLVWRNTLGYMEELTTNYLRHPAYAEYPVVGINWLQAVQFSDGEPIG